jgi:two-component sensor histidine kinase
MQARRVQDPGASALLQEACNRVSSIATIHELLYRSGTFGQVNLVAYARALVPTMVAFCGADQRIQVRVEGEDIMFDLERAVPCGLMLTELVSNVCKHAFPKGARGELLVSVAAADDCVSITAEDNGVGLPEWFDPVKTASLGLKIVKTLTDQLGGRVSFDRGAGNRVQIHLPRTPRAV